MKIQTAIALSNLPIIGEVDELNTAIAQYEPLNKAVQSRVFQKIKLDWNYHSNAIEGNQLNYGETVAFLMHGITAKGKTLKDHLDIKGHNDAINFLLDIIKDYRDISETDIRTLHKIILVEAYDVDAITTDGQPTKKRISLGEYKTTPNSVKTRTGEMHYYATPEETPILMGELMQWYHACKDNDKVHPIVFASLFHHQFVAIHPFDDGNGRLGRMLMNLILMKYRYLPIVIKNEDKNNYYSVLSQADAQQYIPLIEYLANLTKHSLSLQLKAIKGESIEEETDIDKEIALLKKGLDKKIIERAPKHTDLLNARLTDSIDKLYVRLFSKLNTLAELFLKFEVNYITFHKRWAPNTGDYLFENSVNDVEQVYNFFKNSLDNEISMISFVLEGFKSNPFSMKRIDLKITLGKFQFVINHENTSIAKYYNEPLTEQEINDFVNNIMKDILNEIKQHSK